MEIKGYWEEQFDNHFNNRMFVIPFYQMVGGEEVGPEHPLVGAWEDIPTEKASEMGLQIIVEN